LLPALVAFAAGAVNESAWPDAVEDGKTPEGFKSGKVNYTRSNLLGDKITCGLFQDFLIQVGEAMAYRLLFPHTSLGFTYGIRSAERWSESIIGEYNFGWKKDGGVKISCIPAAPLDGSCKFYYHDHISRTAFVQMNREFSCAGETKLAYNGQSWVWGAGASAYGEKLYCESSANAFGLPTSTWKLLSNNVNTTVSNGILDVLPPNFSCVPK
ncbi:hypothetical protein PMAYCL1PPCAC_13085, partial [Pristionchus mayeri]